jgi:hypothetical protein
MTRRKRTCRPTGFASGVPVVTLAILSVGAGAAPATPDYPFSGRWRIDTTSISGDTKPTVFQVRDGRFKRDDNASVTADGHPHPVAGDGYVDEQSISVESDHLIKEVDKIRGKLAYTVGYSISPDGNTLTSHVASYTSPDGQAVRNVTVNRRVGLAEKGAHLLSGTWKLISVTVDSKHDWILKLNGNRFSQRTDGGSGYDAIIGGPPVRLDGDNSGVRAQITRPRPDVIVETDLSAKGTIDDILSMQLMPDGRTIQASGVYGPEKRTTTFTMRKQPE